MLARTLHIKQTSFRMLPNPTVYRWDSKAFDLQRLLDTFKGRLEYPYTTVHTDQIDEIRNRIGTIQAEFAADPTGRSYQLLDALHDAIDTVDDYLTRRLPVSDLLDVIRLHLQEVLGKLNDGDTFDRLNEASPSGKEKCLMDIYFDEIRPALTGSVLPQQPQQPPSPSPSPSPALPGPSNPQQQIPQQLTRRTTTGLSIGEKTGNIWCALVFRMLCWLMLHDFHQKDVQIPKSELLGSRLPVYVV